MFVKLKTNIGEIKMDDFILMCELIRRKDGEKIDTKCTKCGKEYSYNNGEYF